MEEEGGGGNRGGYARSLAVLQPCMVSIQAGVRSERWDEGSSIPILEMSLHCLANVIDCGATGFDDAYRRAVSAQR